MSKINATYSSGYYLSPDTDYRKLEEEQRAQQRRKRGRPDDADASGTDPKRQTFAIPFTLICEHCNQHIARGTHVYTNRRPTGTKYLNAIRIWELEIRCRYCRGLFYLHTDPATAKETGGYTCARGCRRGEGDFYVRNQQNEEVRQGWELEKAAREANPLAALERENEAARELAERNRQIEEDVLANAAGGEGWGHPSEAEALLVALRARRAGNAVSPVMSQADDDDEDKETENEKETKEQEGLGQVWEWGGDGRACPTLGWGGTGGSSRPAGPAIARETSEVAAALRRYGGSGRAVLVGDPPAPSHGGGYPAVGDHTGPAPPVARGASRNAFILEEEGEEVVDFSPKREQGCEGAYGSVRVSTSSTRSVAQSKGAAPRSSFLKSLLDDDSDSCTEDEKK